MKKVYERIEHVEKDSKVKNLIKQGVEQRIEKTLEFKANLERIRKEIKEL